MSFGIPLDCTVAKNLERDQALWDVAQIVRSGYQIKIENRKEEDISRDKWNSINKQDTAGIDLSVNLYALPVIYDPTDKQLEQAGIRERVGAVVWTSMYDWNQQGFPLTRLQRIDMIRATVIINGQKMELKAKAQVDPYHDTYLYIVLGVNRI